MRPSKRCRLKIALRGRLDLDGHLTRAAQPDVDVHPDDDVAEPPVRAERRGCASSRQGGPARRPRRPAPRDVDASRSIAGEPVMAQPVGLRLDDPHLAGSPGRRHG